MAEELLEDRVKQLEESLKSLTQVPAQIVEVRDRVTTFESQIVQLRTETRDGFAAVLEVIDSSSKATQKLYDDGQRHADRQLEDVKEEIVVTLGTQMRVLHEDLVERIKVLGKA